MKKNVVFFWVLMFFVSATKIFSQNSEANEFPDVEASFPGGETELQKFLAENVKFPEICMDMGAQGRVFMKFTVEIDGSISNIEVEKNNTGCDGFESEARRVISLMPKWSPGEMKGEPKATICLLPFNFKLDGGNEAEITKKSKKLNANWASLDFGFVSTNSSDEWSNKILQSSSFGLNLFEYKLPIFKQYLGLTSGLGFNFRTITFQNKYAMVSTDSTITLQEGNPTLYDSLASIRYSTFTQGFVQVPLLLDFSTKTRQAKSFSIAAGVIGGLRMYAFHQLRGKYSNGDKFNNQMRNDKFYHSNLFNLDATVRIGYGAIGVFGTYSLTSLFHKEAASKINPFCVGISFNFDYNADSGKKEFEMMEEEPIN